ncbi:hypothetical protein POJ06DRAFT_257064 [Lipomyces tetrasporus]|uniref:Uncharacterized protein n=1 Tax=Lipomyces tetrasporus TaxID=54092 RepID=A0AAD7QTM4_9ASCO|nr:uncharacterized protein POJ06DRAFT_257064 [Lipomyces tetrasporus]KAJ8099482.1 hypothetical protein POJ06DRAFT_257064 [Lipomyces tetrasporus]
MALGHGQALRKLVIPAYVRSLRSTRDMGNDASIKCYTGSNVPCLLLNHELVGRNYRRRSGYRECYYQASLSYGGTQYVFNVVGESKNPLKIYRYFVPGTMVLIFVLYILVVTSFSLEGAISRILQVETTWPLAFSSRIPSALRNQSKFWIQGPRLGRNTGPSFPACPK